MYVYLNGFKEIKLLMKNHEQWLIIDTKGNDSEALLMQWGKNVNKKEQINKMPW